ITTVSYPIRSVKRYPASGPDERDRLGKDLLRLRHVDEHQARSCQVELGSRKFRGTRVPAEHFDVTQGTFVDQFSGQIDGVLTPLDAHHSSSRSDALGEEF